LDLGFVGSHELTIDAKGRVSIPSDFRGKIQAEDPEFAEGVRARLVIVQGLDTQKHFKIYTIATYQAIRKRIESMPHGMERMVLDASFVSNASIVPVIEDGRIQLTQKMRERLGLENKAMFVAESDKFLLYHPDIYAEKQARMAAYVMAQMAKLEAGVEFDPEFLLSAGAGTPTP
jgi:Uncharacterized protein conserved in bacteria